MNVVAFILLIISLNKLFLMATVTKEDIKYIFKDTQYTAIKIILSMTILDGIVSVICSIYLLLI